MLYNWIKLDTNTFFRQYGNYIYLFNQVTKADILLENASFLSKISRTFKKIETIYDEIIIHDNIDEKKTHEIYESIFHELIENGFLIASASPVENNQVNFSYLNSVEFERTQTSEDVNIQPMQLLENYFSKHPTPFELCVDLTKMCNERCIHCYHFEYNKANLPLKKLSEVLKEFRSLGGLKIKFSGGECMLHPEFISCLQVARENDLSISVLSNLTCCSPAIIEALQKNRISQLQVSLYSMRAEVHDSITQRTGSFNKTMSAIYDLYAANIPVQIHCPLLKVNYPYWKEVQEFGKKLSMKTTFSPELIVRADHSQNNTQYGLTRREIISFLEEYDPITDISCWKHCKANIKRQKICEIGQEKICLSADGFYYPCNGCIKLVLGNCFEKSLFEVWNGKEIKRLRSLTVEKFVKCLQCENFEYCKICPAHNFNENGDIFKPCSFDCLFAELNRQRYLKKKR